MHREQLAPPPCPVCEEPGKHNRHLAEVLGPWVCDGCALFFYGTTSEFERYGYHRVERARIRAKAETDGRQ